MTEMTMTDEQWERLHRLSALDAQHSKISRREILDVMDDLQRVKSPLHVVQDASSSMDLSALQWGRVLDSYSTGSPTSGHAYTAWIDQMQAHGQSEDGYIRAIRSMTLQTQPSLATPLEQRFAQTRLASSADATMSDPSTTAFWDTPGFSTYCPTPARSDALASVRIGVKDLFAMSGVRCSAGSKMLSEFYPTYTATVVSRLEEAGATVVGRTAMDAFGMGSWTRTSSWGRCLHPMDPDRTAGGSSGGSAAAVALGLCDVALGSDTGGSVRQPASFCGVVGYKPSYGAFSRYGMVAYAASLDCPGWFASSLPQLMSVLTVPGMGAPDGRDMQCVGLVDPGDVGPVRRVAYFPEIFSWSGMDSDVLQVYRDALDRLQELGIALVAYPMWDSPVWSSVYYTIACAEAHSDLARYQGMYMPTSYWRQQEQSSGSSGDYLLRISEYRSAMFEGEVAQRILLGAAVLSGDDGDALYRAALARRQAYAVWMRTMMQDVDFLMLPTAPFVAPYWNVISQMRSTQVYAADRLTVLPSLVGAPSVSMPWGYGQQGFPVGIQCVGRVGGDLRLLRQLCALDSSMIQRVSWLMQRVE